MILKKRAKIIFQLRNPLNLKFDNITKEQIQKNWLEYQKENPKDFNGEIYVANQIHINNNIIEIEIARCHYADLKYAKKTQKISLSSLFVAILIKTIDNYYLMIKNFHDTVNLLGGTVSDLDLEKNTLNPLKTLERELKEELGLSTNDLLEYNQLFLKIPDGKTKTESTGIIYIGKINYTKEELEKSIRKNICSQ